MKLNTDRVPLDLDDAVQMIVSALEPDEVERIAGMPGADAAQHFGFGMWLRNNWSLWDKEAHLVQWFRANLKIGHADDISGIILEAVVAKVIGIPYDPHGAVEKIHAHWRRFGCNEFGEEIQ